jgi:hypothetical protein
MLSVIIHHYLKSDALLSAVFGKRGRKEGEIERLLDRQRKIREVSFAPSRSPLLELIKFIMSGPIGTLRSNAIDH